MNLAAHINALCGARVSLNIPFDWRSVRYPELSGCAVARAQPDSTQPMPHDFLAATIVPDDALLVTLVVCEGGATFVRSQHGQDLFAMARPEYCMRGIVPDDSVLHAFVYTDRGGGRLMGLFDANKIAGEDLLAAPPLVRHGKVFALYHEAAAAQQVPTHILYHGVYYENACLALDLARLHFCSSRVLRLPLSTAALACEHFEIETAPAGAHPEIETALAGAHPEIETALAGAHPETASS